MGNVPCGDTAQSKQGFISAISVVKALNVTSALRAVAELTLERLVVIMGR